MSLMLLGLMKYNTYIRMYVCSDHAVKSSCCWFLFNRQVERNMKIYNIVKMLETLLDRKYFTKHGQHLNLQGKEQISMKLTMVIKEIFTKKQSSPICLQWKDSTSERLKSRSTETEERVVHPEVLNHSNLDKLSRISHPSKCQRKNAALINPDFLWT